MVFGTNNRFAIKSKHQLSGGSIFGRFTAPLTLSLTLSSTLSLSLTLEPTTVFPLLREKLFRGGGCEPIFAIHTEQLQIHDGKLDTKFV